MLAPDLLPDLMQRLRSAYPEARAPDTKGGRDPFRSLVSCLLSAQSLDRNTMAASTALFALADTPGEILTLSDEAIVDAIRPAGLYNVKTRNLRKMCRFLLDECDGTVPQTRAGLMAIPGIGRKCADIVLHFTFGEAVIAVDTHVHRVCNRMGLAEGKTEAQTAQSLDARIPDAFRMDGHVILLTHGKRTCRARAPRCDACTVAPLCEAVVGKT
jgi:endonuclease-3